MPLSQKLTIIYFSFTAYPAPDDEMEYTPEDKIPLNALSLKEIFRSTGQPVPEMYDYIEDEPQKGLIKRSRYYRKYPGKRQNRQYHDLYDCNPNSKETIRLLYAIHQAKLGDIEHIVFCNRLRNPKGIIPNPRYIGKRNEN